MVAALTGHHIPQIWQALSSSYTAIPKEKGLYQQATDTPATEG